ncbi:hypothetical protein ACWFMI_24020, partial [Nocardiopsis terrae]
GDLATRGDFGAEVAPGSKITVKKGGLNPTGRAEGRQRIWATGVNHTEATSGCPSVSTGGVTFRVARASCE